MDRFTYKDVLFRIGYFRNKNNLSLRDTSLKIDTNEKHMSRVESGIIALKVSTLLDFMELVNITPMEFFYPNPDNYAKDKELLDIIQNLSNENKQTLIELAKKIK